MIRDVAGSYRRALQETVQHYSSWRPSPQEIDELKGEGKWNNDWDASLELLRRHGGDLPERSDLIEVFSGYYFGGDPEGDPSDWTGFIGDEPLLVEPAFLMNSPAEEFAGDSSAEPNHPRLGTCCNSDWGSTIQP